MKIEFKYKNCFSILSTNIQSIGSKFEEVKIFIKDMRANYNFEFSAICLQECQFKETDNIAHFKLDNYKLISHGKTKKPCSTKGGPVL